MGKSQLVEINHKDGQISGLSAPAGTDKLKECTSLIKLDDYLEGEIDILSRPSAHSGAGYCVLRFLAPGNIW